MRLKPVDTVDGKHGSFFIGPFQFIVKFPGFPFAEEPVDYLCALEINRA